MRGTSADHIKRKIKTLVALYRAEMPEEYGLLIRAVEMKRRMLHDPEYATLEGGRHNRALFEISETLSSRLIMGMEVKEIEWFKTIPGSRWFARTFREFSLPSEI